MLQAGVSVNLQWKANVEPYITKIRNYPKVTIWHSCTIFMEPLVQISS